MMTFCQTLFKCLNCLFRSIKKKDDELKMFKQKIESLEKKSRDAELRYVLDTYSV